MDLENSPKRMQEIRRALRENDRERLKEFRAERQELLKTKDRKEMREIMIAKYKDILE